jgi:KDO2-lipid IV(A) lauroyltransferase
MASKLRRKLRHRTEYVFLLALMGIVRRVSLKTSHRIANGLGRISFTVLRIRRRVTLDNLRMAFPEKSEKELKGIAFRAYKNFAKMMMEYIRFPIMDRDTVLSLCEVQGRENLDWAVKNGKGAVLVAGHFGNWELMGACLAHMGYPVSFLVGRQKNKLVDDQMNRYREGMGVKLIHMGVAVRGVIRALRSNEWVAMLADQDAHREGVFVDFMGRKASNHQGPAVFALRTSAPILFGSAIRRPDGKHLMVAELLRFDGLTEVTPENILTVTQAYTALLEKKVREYPDQWFWMHRRWKTKPEPTGGETAAPSAGEERVSSE